jgi:hypothetical protein
MDASPIMLFLKKIFYSKASFNGRVGSIFDHEVELFAKNMIMRPSLQIKPAK